MKGPVGYGILFALSFVIVKMGLYFAGLFSGDIIPLSFINMLFLLLSISLGLYFYFQKREDHDVSMITELKQGLKAGMIYTFIISGFLFLYYNNIDDAVIYNMQRERIEQFESDLSDPDRLRVIKEGNAAFELMTADEILEEATSNIEGFISARSVFLISLMGMMMLSVFYSLLITIIYRKVLFRDRFR